MAERSRFLDAVEKLKNRLRNPNNTPETVTQIQAAILRTGLIWQQVEPMWEIQRMREEIRDNQGYEQPLHPEIAILQRKGLVTVYNLTPVYPNTLCRVNASGRDIRVKVANRSQETPQLFKGQPQTT